MTEREKRKHRVCFTGHRPEKIYRDEKYIQKDIEKEIHRSIEEGYYVFISGMARGVDILAAEAVLKIRKNNPKIKLICACPYIGFERTWSYNWQFRYNKIIANANLIKYISQSYGSFCFQKRNEWMVDHSSKVIAVFNGSNGGTKNTIEYAKRKNISIVLINC